MLRTYWEAHEGAQLPEGEDLVEENWTPFWRDTLQVVRVTDRITLVPAWTDPPEGVEFPIRIDPGMAFGAGDHPTTRLCLRILEDLAVGGRLPARMLDVGTGTGVLSLAAGFLGAEQVHALDIDPFGYAACRRNARLNGLEGSVHPLLLSLDLLDGRFPLIFANIVAGQLEALASLLMQRIETPGGIILSGFEADNERRVREAFGVEVEQRREEEGWVALLARSS
jgi:ribosomal protein L11 methyltransferase